MSGGLWTLLAIALVVWLLFSGPVLGRGVTVVLTSGGGQQEYGCMGVTGCRRAPLAQWKVQSDKWKWGELENREWKIETSVETANCKLETLFMNH
jgi:hypothetical protein